MSRGVQLPPRGSTQDAVMVEMVERERDEKLKMWEMMAMAIGLFTMADIKPVTGIVRSLKEDLRSYLSHQAYTADSLYQNVFRQIAKIKERDDRMAKLEAMTASD